MPCIGLQSNTECIHDIVLAMNLLCVVYVGIAAPPNSLPESVSSDKSFGSSGSGGAMVGSRRNSTTSTKTSGELKTLCMNSDKNLCRLLHRMYIHLCTGSDSGVVEARRSSVSAQFHRGHCRSHSSGTRSDAVVKSPGETAKSAHGQRQCSAPSVAGRSAHHPDNMDFNAILDDLDQLTKQLDGSNINDNNGDYTVDYIHFAILYSLGVHIIVMFLRHSLH